MALLIKASELLSNSLFLRPSDGVSMNAAKMTLSDMIGALSSEAQKIREEIKTMARLRQEEVRTRAAMLIPKISRDVMRNLANRYPEFVNRPSVTNAFSDYSVILGFWHPVGYAEALEKLRMNLQAHLVEVDDNADSHDFFHEKTAHLSEIERRRYEAEELLRALEVASNKNLRLSQAHADRLTTLSNSWKNRKSLASTTPGSSAPMSSDSDLAIWLITDIPTSWRTLLLYELSEHRGPTAVAATPRPFEERSAGSFGGAGASGSFAQDAIPMAAGAAAPDVIATDDRLGAFS